MKDPWTPTRLSPSCRYTWAQESSAPSCPSSNQSSNQSSKQLAQGGPAAQKRGWPWGFLPTCQSINFLFKFTVINDKQSSPKRARLKSGLPPPGTRLASTPPLTPMQGAQSGQTSQFSVSVSLSVSLSAALQLCSPILLVRLVTVPWTSRVSCGCTVHVHFWVHPYFLMGSVEAGQRIDITL